MTKSELIEIFRRQYGFEPEGAELETLLDEYHVDDDDNYEPQPQRQQSRVYNFTGNSYHSDSNKAASNLIQEIKDIFGGLSGLAGRSVRKNDIDENDLNEFSYMLAAFLCKSALYFLLKSAYSKGYSAVNL